MHELFKMFSSGPFGANPTLTMKNLSDTTANATKALLEEQISLAEAATTIPTQTVLPRILERQNNSSYNSSFDLSFLSKALIGVS
jgi:hypothetical protein